MLIIRFTSLKKCHRHVANFANSDPLEPMGVANEIRFAATGARSVAVRSSIAAIIIVVDHFDYSEATSDEGKAEIVMEVFQ